MKKVYLFYLIDKDAISKLKKHRLIQDSLTLEEMGGNGHLLYAYTSKKSIAQLFTATRPMEKFYLKTVEMTKEELDAFDSHFYSFNKLDYTDLQFSDSKSVVTCITSGECWYIKENAQETMYEFINGQIKILSPDLFLPKYKIALDALEYFRFDFDSSEIVEDGVCDEFYNGAFDFMRLNGWKNELGLFTSIYEPVTDVDKIVKWGTVS